MLAAINPANRDLFTSEMLLCHSQGELLYLIETNNIREVFIDPQLPGYLSIDALISYLRTKFPGIEISIIKSELPVFPEAAIDYSITEVKRKNPIPPVILVVIVQLVLNLILQYNTLTIRQIIYFGIAGAVATILCVGGMIWINKREEKSLPLQP